MKAVALQVSLRTLFTFCVWKALVSEVMEYLAAESTALNRTLKMVQLFAIKCVDWIRM